MSVLRCAALALALQATACTGMAPRAPEVAPPPAFELAGRVSARYEERVFSSALRWKQLADSDEIWFATPLGQTIAYLVASAGGATLTAADQKQYRAASIENLTRSALGFRLPVAGMRYWVLGQPAPGMSVTGMERDAANRITRFQQGDFQITFDYVASDATRPSRLDAASGDTAQVRLVIDNLVMSDAQK
jgi:outer membrane lipoprotein LolB